MSQAHLCEVLAAQKWPRHRHFLPVAHSLKAGSQSTISKCKDGHGPRQLCEHRSRGPRETSRRRQMIGGERGNHQRVCLDGDVFQPEAKGADERREQQAKCCVWLLGLPLLCSEVMVNEPQGKQWSLSPSHSTSVRLSFVLELIVKGRLGQLPILVWFTHDPPKCVYNVKGWFTLLVPKTLNE